MLLAGSAHGCTRTPRTSCSTAGSQEGLPALALLCGALVCHAPGAHAQEADSLCGRGGCEFLVGIGGTYHYWAKTDGIVAAFMFDWSEGRYELGAFRMTTPQMLEFHDELPAYRVANPYWGFSLSRRWRLFGRGPSACSWASEPPTKRRPMTSTRRT
jgi:hypothetical protein